MKAKNALPDLPSLPALPTLPTLPELPALPGSEERASKPIEEEAAEELEALQSDFQKRAKNEDKRFYQAVDSEFWVALCFQTREQKERFLEALKLLDLGDKYLDGLAVAERLGVSLEKQAARKHRPFSKKLTSLT